MCVCVCVTDLFASILYILHNVRLTAGLSLGGLGLRGVHGYCLGYKQKMRRHEASSRVCLGNVRYLVSMHGRCERVVVPRRESSCRGVNDRQSVRSQ